MDTKLMMRLRRCATLLVYTALLGLGACDAVGDKLDQGTTVAYKKCLDAGSKQGLEPTTVTNFCRKKEQSPAEIEVKGSGWYNSDGSFIFTIRNASNSHVITSAKLHLKRAEADKSQAYLVEGLWVEPGFSYQYIVERHRIYQPPAPEDRARDGQWAVSETRGIKLRM